MLDDDLARTVARLEARIFALDRAAHEYRLARDAPGAAARSSEATGAIEAEIGRLRAEAARLTAGIDAIRLLAAAKVSRAGVDLDLDLPAAGLPSIFPERSDP